MLIESTELLAGHGAVVFDCRFCLADPHQGKALYQQGHIPGAYHLDLNRDLSGPVGPHGGRHPLPDPAVFATKLAACGVGPETPVIAYDDARLAFASRLWWLLRSLGYRQPQLLNGGYQAFLAAGGQPATALPEAVLQAETVSLAPAFGGVCDIEELRVAQGAGALLVDSREPRRYQGLEEPIDPVAGHIPGAINRPWQGVTAPAGEVLDVVALKTHWGAALEAEHLVVYCGSGVTACVNLFALSMLGRDDATLYAGSWSDWCSYL
jgi:thiosulfate/3-mercaptopyruvate sulfurtransferase